MPHQPAVRAIPDGRDLLEAFTELFAPPAGWVLASGYVQEVELRVVASGGDTRHVLPGRYALTQLSGPLGGPYGVTLSHCEGGRIEVVAGMLVRGRSAGVTACSLGAATEPAKPALPLEASGPVEASASGATWAARAHAAAAVGPSGDTEVDEGQEPERGDLVQHFAFGLCEVLSVTGDRLLIRDVARAGRVREIHVDMLVVHPPVERDGKRVFQLSRRG